MLASAPKNASVTQKCVVCGHRDPLRHFACESCLDVPHLNHNAVGAYLKGVQAYLDNDLTCPYDRESVDAHEVPKGSYVRSFSGLWHRGWNRAREIELSKAVRDVYGERWRWEWKDRVHPRPGYLGHGRFTWK